jgi:hypothetical protein
VLEDETELLHNQLEKCASPHNDIAVSAKPVIDYKMEAMLIEKSRETELLKEDSEAAALESQLGTCRIPHKHVSLQTERDGDAKILKGMIVQEEREIQLFKIGIGIEVKALKDQ